MVIGVSEGEYHFYGVVYFEFDEVVAYLNGNMGV